MLKISKNLFFTLIAVLSLSVGAVVETHQTSFSLEDEDASQVYVAGEFNGWDNTADAMIYNDETGVWEISLELLVGRYQYKFVVDGTWIIDPNAEEYVEDEEGNQNSMVVVGDPDAPTGDDPEELDMHLVGYNAPVVFEVPTFYYKNEEGVDEVTVVGNFNDWDAYTDYLVYVDETGYWELDLDFPPGRYEYRLVINGEEQLDEFATENITNADGEEVSILVINEDPEVDHHDKGYIPAEDGEPVPMFYLYDDYFMDVTVVGEFNDWDEYSDYLELNEDTGYWELNLDLPEGEHEYMLVVDGVWRLDMNATKVNNRKSIVVVD